MLASLGGNSNSYRKLLEAVAHLLRAYFGRRLGPGSRDVEDLVQESMMALHRKRSSYDPDLPFTAWLYAIARYKLIDHLRRNRLRRDVPIDQVAEPAVVDRVEACLAAVDVERLLAQLPDTHRLAIRMTRLDGLTVAEAATYSGRSESAIKVSVHRGLRRLASLVGATNGRD